MAGANYTDQPDLAALHLPTHKTSPHYCRSRSRGQPDHTLAERLPAKTAQVDEP